MTFLVGDSLHIVFNLLLALYGGFYVFAFAIKQRVHSYVLFGVLFSFLLAFSAVYSQGFIEGALYFIKLFSIMLIFYLAYLRPVTMLYLVATTLILLFFIELSSVEYGKLNAFPIIAISFIAIAWVSGKELRYQYSGKFTFLLIFFSLLQSISISSRSEMILIVLCLMIYTLRKHRKILIGALLFLPIAYIILMAFIGFYFEKETPVFMPTLSNLERSLMLYHLTIKLPLWPFGFDQQLLSIMVNESMLTFGLNGYSSDKMDPHNYIAYLFMYSGWFGIFVFVFLQLKFFRKIMRVNSSIFMLLIYPIAVITIVITLSPPSTIGRITVIVFLGATLSLFQFKKVKQIS